MGSASPRLAVPVAMLLFCVTTRGAAGAGNPAAAIATAAGHPSRLHLRAEAILTRDGQTQTATLELAGGKRLSRTCVADLCSGEWFDGMHNTAFGINGAPLPDRSDDDAAARTFDVIASTAFAEPGFRAAGGTVAALPLAADARLKYRVTAPGGAPLTAVADPQTHRLTGIERSDGTPYRRLAATVWGATIVYAARPYDRVIAVDAPLEPPAGPPVAVAGVSDIELLSQTLPIVPCTVQGHRARCLIDTGTSPSGVTLDFAEQLGLEPRGQIEIAGSGTYLTGVIDAGPVLLGKAVYDRLRFAVIPRARGAEFDVLVGSDALSDVRISFDIEHRRAQIAPTQIVASGRPIALDFAGGVPYAQVRLGAHDQSEAMLLDTGDSGTLSIGYDEYRKDLGLFTVRTAGSAAGLGGPPMDALQGQLDRADVGGEKIDRVAISAVRGQHTGHIGYGFAARCRQFIVDLGQRRIECRANTAEPEPSAGDSRTF